MRGSTTMPCAHEQPGARPPSTLGPAIERTGALLLHQQCWCWGWDIRDLDGNLLLDHGFVRHRTTEARDSTYTLMLPTGQAIVLWGWGVCFSDPTWGGLMLQRCGFDPYLTASITTPSTVSRVAELQPLRLPHLSSDWDQVAHLLPLMLRWIADYETWVVTVRGEKYRQLSLRACPRMVVKRPIPAARVIETWNSLADQCEIVLQRQIETVSLRGGFA